MVGVPGRSKSCNTCRKRKIACSLEKPECHTCIKSSRVCAGYARERIFIQHQVPGNANQKADKPEQSPASSDDLPIRQKDSAVSKPSKIKSERTEMVKRYRVAQVTATKIMSPTTRTAYRQQVLSEFIFYFAPETQKHLESQLKSQRRDDGIGAWFLIIPSMADLGMALETSVLAVTLAKFGRHNGDPVLVHESLKFYTQGLWELQKALWDPKLMYRDETLAACMLLTGYELAECPNQTIDAWAAHMKGCARLVELRGPSSYTSDLGSGMFLSWRLQEIQQAISERRTTFLHKPEWIELPWAGLTKTHFHQLLDIMAELADVIGAGYRLFEDPTQALEPAKFVLAILDIIDRCWKMDAKLRRFFENLERETDGPIYWPNLSTSNDNSTDDPKLGKVFPVAFHFSNIRMAHMCMLYWADCSILWVGMGYLYKVLAGYLAAQGSQNLKKLWSSMGYLYKKLAGFLGAKGSQNSEAERSDLSHATGLDMTQLPPLGHREDTVCLARNICQCMEFMLQDSSGSMGPISSVFALKVAIETFNDSPGCDRELQWALDIMGQITGQGLRVLAHLPIKMTEHAFLPG